MKPQDNKQHEAEDCPTCHVEQEQQRRAAAQKAAEEGHCQDGNCR